MKGAPALPLSFVLCIACSDAASTNEGSPSSTPSAMVVEVGEARNGRLRDEWVFLGETRSSTRAALAAGAEGEVVALDVRLGDRVEKGDLLLRVDPELARARMAAARASQSETAEELRQAARDRQRAEQLGISVLAEAEIERDVSRAEALRARERRLGAARQEAKVALGRHRLLAPFSGVISARHVDIGDWVTPGEPVLELVDDTDVEIITPVTPELIPRIAIGAEVRVGRGERTAAGKVAGIVRALDPTTRTAPLRIILDPPAPWLLPGQSVDVAFAVEHESGADSVIVPRDSLVYGAVGTRVIKAQSQKAQPIAVTVLACADLECLVSGEGLSAGDSVVTRGNERLRPDQPLSIVPTPSRERTAAAGDSATSAKG